ncbi:hypothetical protein [Salinicoccus sp. YB14-2]|uniref:hypothetical protein n=1 Tax=Salinicoccus sp. YB14-2 TaxID=1572701 RepID=UPI00068F5BC1|nr:hypothetical protein [Salinicoccus sp. YB14-2]
MEGFLHIYNKSHSNKIKKDVYEKIINTYKDTRHFFKILSNNKITSIYYTNEHKNYPYSSDSNRLFCPVGQFAIDKIQLQSQIFSLSSSQVRKVISNLSGAFGISTVDLESEIIDVYTHVVRAEGVFIFENSEKIIVGTDPLIVSVFSSDKLEPDFDASNFISFFEQGYFADENTPFKNVVSLPPNTHVQINKEVNYTDLDNTYDTAFQGLPTEDFFNEISTNFLNSFDIVQDKSKTIRSGLTGGKDSRLVLLALINKGFNIQTHTTGFPDHPDVIIAQQLAELLEIPHKVKSRTLKEDNSINVNLEKRIKEITTVSSGLITAYDSIATNTTFKDGTNFNGVAASVITGGFNKFSHKVNANMADALKKPLYKFSNYYNESDNKYSRFLEEFSNKNDDLGTLLHLFFLKYRTGRWTSDSRIAKSYSSNSYSVFLDNQLTKSAMKLNMKDLRKEIIHYKLIEQLNPSILKVPFNRYRFAFEENGPSSPNDYHNWLKREPIYSKSKIGSYNWRSLGNNDKKLISAFKELILQDKNSIVFDVVNYNSIEKLLNSKLTNRTNKFIWSIASQIYYTDYMKKQNISPIEKISLKTPSDKIITDKVPAKVIDLTPHYQPLNHSIELSANNSINFKDKEGNAYLKTYNGGFSKVPDSFNLKGVKQARFNTNMELDNLENPRMSIIFYTKEKRFKTILLEAQYDNDNIVVFNDIVKIPKDAVYYRTAIYFKDTNNKNHKLNYSYVELHY